MGLDDGVDEAEREWVLLHLHRVELVEAELGDAHDTDGELAAEVSLFRLKVDDFVNLLGRENVIPDRNVIDEDALQFVSLGAKNFVFLESFQVIDGQVAYHILAVLALARSGLLRLLKREFGHGLNRLLGRGLRV